MLPIDRNTHMPPDSERGICRRMHMQQHMYTRPDTTAYGKQGLAIYAARQPHTLASHVSLHLELHFVMAIVNVLAPTESKTSQASNTSRSWTPAP
jgi:hypothetical protein